MTGFEAIAQISLLIAKLIEKAKGRDKETFGLIQQIQTYQLIVDGELKKRDADIKERDTEIARMVDRIKELETKLQKPKQEMFIPRMFGESTYQRPGED